MSTKILIINLLFGATFFNHLHALAFIPQHNRPLLLVFFPLFLFFIHKYKSSFSYNLILWFSAFFLIASLSFVWNLFTTEFNYYIPEAIFRFLSYLTLFYFSLIGIIFRQNKKFISEKFYSFFILIGLIQIYAVLDFPLSNYITYILYYMIILLLNQSMKYLKNC